MVTRIPYETLVELAQQLPIEQQQDLIRRLQERAQSDSDNTAEKMYRLKQAQISVAVKKDPSIRRQDWYADDGR
jgi:hypothetical protein